MSIEDTRWKTKLPPWTDTTMRVRGQRGTAPWGVAKSSTQFTSMLTEAVRQGRPIDYIDSLIKAGADVNAQHAITGLSAMHIAAKWGMCAHIEFLAEAGAEVNGRSFTTGASPLYVACYYNQYDTVATLLSFGADVETPDKNQRSCLMLVASEGNLEILELLAGAGAPLDAQDINGNTALHHACRAGRTTCAMELIDRDASTSVVNRAGRTPRFEAEAAGKTQCAVDVSVAARMQELRQSDTWVPPATAIDDAIVVHDPRPRHERTLPALP